MAKKKEEILLKPLCPYCRKEWTNNMIKTEMESSSEGCDTCDYGASMVITIDIICEHCKKLVYRKEGYEVR